MLDVAIEHFVGFFFLIAGILALFGGFKHYFGWDPELFICVSAWLLGSVLISGSLILFGIIQLS